MIGWQRKLPLFLCGFALLICLHLLQLTPLDFETPCPAAPTIQEASFASLVPSASEPAVVAARRFPNASQPGPMVMTQNHTRRMFLAIFTSPIADGRLRNVIRKTYLAMESNKQGPYAGRSMLPSTCSLTSFAKQLVDKTNHLAGCDVVYSFIAEGQYRNRFASEKDIIYLNLTNSNGGKESFNRVNVLFRHLLSLNWTEAEIHSLPFDFVAYTHSRVLLFPTQLWPPELFQSDGKTSIYDHPRLYSGIVNKNMGADKSQRSTHSMFQDYVLLSRDLLKSVLRLPFHRKVKNDQTEVVLETVIHSTNTTIVDDENDASHLARSTTAILPLHKGVSILDGSKYNYMGFLQQWDDYKDQELVIYEDPIEETRIRSNPRIMESVGSCRHGPRMLLGIFTVLDNAIEAERRNTIRETYLSFYRSVGNKTEPDRICSLNDIISTKNPRRQVLLEHCQLAYVFVVGGNPDGSTERVAFNDVEPMTLPTDDIESDVVVLNIRENMKEGKSQSFFKYATTIVDEFVYFDYLAKADTDTLLYPSRVLDDHIKLLPGFPGNVRIYGGSPRGKIQMDHLKGPAYCIGAFYWMSVDLARYITSPECDRENLKVFSEDKSIGNFIHSHPLPIRRIKLKMFSKAFEHPLKEIGEFRERWMEHLSHIRREQSLQVQ